MNAVDVLEEARLLLAQPDRWAKGAMAFDNEGKEIMPGYADACSFCTAGAALHIARVIGAEEDLDEAWAYLKRTAPYGENLAEFNDDNRTEHRDVMALYDRALDAARRDEAEEL